MCVIAVCRTRRLTSTEVELMDAANPHGIGIAWPNRKAGHVEYVKGLDVAETLALLPRLPLPHVVHFRFASVGAVGVDLCHPFALSSVPGVAAKGRARAVLFHNGTWRDWPLGVRIIEQETAIVARETGWSDSRVMAALMALYSPKAVADIVGPAQRLAVLHAAGRIELFGAFERYRGIEVSNLWWREMAERATTALAPLPIDDDDDTPICTPLAPLMFAEPTRKASKSKRKKKATPSPETRTFLFAETAIDGCARRYPPVPRPVTPARW